MQRFAYLMVALMALHVGLVLGRSALTGTSTPVTVTFADYLAVIAAYAVLRTAKAVRGRNGRQAADA